jgi:flagellar basal-body rod protein FlgG
VFLLIRALYTSGWSLIADTKRMDVVSNNLANADTNGYKKDLAINQSFQETLTKRINDYKSFLNPSSNIGNMKLGRGEGEIFTNFNQGEMINTGNSLNFAISNSENSFFTIGIEDDEGNMDVKYSRDGSFIIGEDGYLKTTQGNYLLGENGPIRVNSDNIKITKEGDLFENEVFNDNLRITAFESTDNLDKIGGNLLEPDEEAQEIESDAEILQGYLEKSNVNVINEMVEMITVLRSYEANQKLIQYEDNTLQKAVNDIGLLR